MSGNRLQTLLRLIYPPLCLSCGEMVEAEQGLCGTCWREVSFAGSSICDLCGVSLIGQLDDEVAHCDDCLTTARPWDKGRAAFLYKGVGRKMVLALKHGDRFDIIDPATKWLSHAAAPLLSDNPVVVPVPLHTRRRLRRRYNQSALLAEALACRHGLDCVTDALVRAAHTPALDGMSKEERFATLATKITANPDKASSLCQRPVLLIDDVMTSGATLAAAAEASLAAGANKVFVLALARVAKDH